MVIYKSTYDPIPVPDLDIYTFLFQDSEYNTKRSRDSPQVIDGATGKSLSFNQIYDMSGRLASAWKKDVGLKKGDVVAVFAPNQYDHCVLYFSLLAARCIVSPGYVLKINWCNSSTHNGSYTATQNTPKVDKEKLAKLLTFK